MDSIELTREEEELLRWRPNDSRQSTRGAQDSAKSGSDDTAHLGPLDTRRQLEVLEAFHHDVADRFADALSRGLQRLVEVQLLETQAMNYSQFAFSRGKPTCYLVLQAPPLPTPLALDLSPALLYPLLDLLLGGGKHPCPPPERPPTELEQRLARRLVRLLLDELHDAWEPLLAVDLSIERVEHDAQRVRVVAPGDDVIVLSFLVRVAEQSGLFALCLPQRAIRKIVDKLLVGEGVSHDGIAHPSAAGSAAVHELTVHFDAERLSQSELENLRPGDVLLTDLDADGAVQVSVDGQPMFLARPGNLQGRRAVVLGSKIA